MVLRSGGDPDDPAAAIPAANQFRNNFDPDMLADPELLKDTAGQAASKVSAIPEVREALLALQHDFADKPPAGFAGAVLDGRDIGTVICPEAKYKLFVTADTEIRAERRHKELQSRGIAVTYEAVLADMRQRDARDSGRKTAPLKPAEDAVVLDTTNMDIDQVLEEALRIIRR
jgi:cytidylate kinase